MPDNTKKRKPRSRPPAVVERDNAILTQLAVTPSTKVGLAIALGIPEEDVYLSLRRLRAAGKATRMRGNTSHTWTLVSDTNPAAPTRRAAPRVPVQEPAPDPIPATAVAFSAPDPEPTPAEPPASVPQVVFQPQGPSQPEVWF